ncbi:YdcH family protein, partial [Francisella tularensis]
SNQMKKYEDLDKKIYSLESTGMFEDSQLEDLKKQRLEIKDMLYKALKS